MVHERTCTVPATGLDLGNTLAAPDLNGYTWTGRPEWFPKIGRFNARNVDSNSCRSLLAGTRRRRSRRRDPRWPPYAPNCPRVIQFAHVPRRDARK